MAGIPFGTFGKDLFGFLSGSSVHDPNAGLLAPWTYWRGELLPEGTNKSTAKGRAGGKEQRTSAAFNTSSTVSSFVHVTGASPLDSSSLRACQAFTQQERTRAGTQRPAQAPRTLRALPCRDSLAFATANWLDAHALPHARLALQA